MVVLQKNTIDSKPFTAGQVNFQLERLRLTGISMSHKFV